MNSLINDYQSGFRPQHSTTTALLNLTDNWLSSFDEGKVVIAIMLDLKKAFDTVDFQLLLQKLRNQYGVDELTLRWFTSYLNGRTQATCVNGNMSDFLHVECGIPQGSILGPLLFILHINDMPSVLQYCDISMYADDTVLYCSGNECDIVELVRKVNIDLERVNIWLKQNKLSLNVKKTEYIVLGTKNRLRKLNETDINLEIDNTPLRRVTGCKHLGVMVDENLTWEDHVNYLVKKSNSGIHMLKSIRSFVNKTTLESVYNALVSSHLTYCNEVWGNCGKTLKNSLQKIQNRGARIINNSPWYSSATENRNKLNWKILDEKRTDNIAVMMYKILNNDAPTYLSSKFSYRENTYNLRQGELCVNLVRPKTEQLKRSFMYRGSVIWNNLPHHVKASPSVHSFKRGLMRGEGDDNV